MRSSSDQLAVLYFHDVFKLNMEDKPRAVFWTLGFAVPMVAVVGSLISGIVSDKFFRGHRSPVAMWLYFLQAIVIGLAAVGHQFRLRWADPAAAFFSAVCS